MNLEIETGLEGIWAGISKFEGLCTNFAKKYIGGAYWETELLYAIKFYAPITQKQLSKYYEIPKQTVNKFIKQLETGNIISISVSSEDKRRKEIRFTELGEKYAEKYLKPTFEFNEMLVNKVGIKTVRQISDGLNKLVAALEEIEANREKEERSK